MNKNFAFPLHISGTEEDLKKLQSQLERLGYTTNNSEGAAYDARSQDIMLTTDWGGYPANLGYTRDGAIYNRVQLRLPQDWELALALAAMRKDGAFEKGELLVLTSQGLHISRGALAMVISDRHSKNQNDMVEIRWMDETARNTQSWGEGSGYMDNRFRRATREEIINFYRHGSPVLKSDPLPFTETRKVIGYKAPFDMFDGQIKAGTVFTKNAVGNYMEPDSSRFFLPAEIVEKWEPVYEEKPKVLTLMIGQNKKVAVYVEPGKSIKAEGFTIDVEALKILHTNLGSVTTCETNVIGFPWSLKEARVTIGCLEVNMEDLTKVLRAYNEKGGEV